MSSASLEIATRGLEAYNRGDYESVFELLADDVVTVVSSGLPNEGTYHGHEGFREMLTRWEEAWDSFSVEPREMTEEREWVIVAARQFGRGRGSGVDVDREIAYLFRVRGESIDEMRICDSVDEALAIARGERAA